MKRILLLLTLLPIIGFSQNIKSEQIKDFQDGVNANTKLTGIEAGAEVNVQADWNESNSSFDSFILNKPDVLVSEDTLTEISTKSDLLDYYTKIQSDGKYPIDSIWYQGSKTYYRQGGVLDSVKQVEDILQIGDFYDGGIVYWIHSSGTYGYCVSSYRISSSEVWSLTSTVTDATNSSIGDGIINTDIIIGDQGSGNYAAYLSDTINLNGYNDWFLPTTSSLQVIRTQLHSTGKHTFPSGKYWSSVEYSSSAAYSFNISTGSTYIDTKISENNSVVIVRMFSIGGVSNGITIRESDGTPSYDEINIIEFLGGVVTNPSANTARISISGSGTVTSVGISSTDFSVTGSPITTSGTITLDLNTASVESSNLNNNVISGQTEILSGLVDTDEIMISDGGLLKKTDLSVLSDYINVGAGTGDITAVTAGTGLSGGGTTGDVTLNLSAATDSEIGGIKVSTTDGGLMTSNDILLQNDNRLTTATALDTDYIAFWDVSGTAQRKTLISDLPVTGGSTLTVRESDGSPSVSSVSTIEFANATVSDQTGGVVRVTPSGGGASTASEVSITDSGNKYISDNVEGALQEAATGSTSNPYSAEQITLPSNWVISVVGGNLRFSNGTVTMEINGTTGEVSANDFNAN